MRRLPLLTWQIPVMSIGTPMTTLLARVEPTETGRYSSAIQFSGDSAHWTSVTVIYHFW